MFKKMYAVLLSLFLTITILPQNVYSEEEPEGTSEEITETEEEVTETEEIEPEEVIPEKTLEEEEVTETDVEEGIEEPEHAESETPAEEEISEDPEEIIEEEIQEETEVFEAADGDYTVGSYTYTVSSGTAYIKKYNGSESSVTLPTSVKIGDSSYKLTTLGKSAFADNYNLKSITIPAEYKKIEISAFKNCVNLSSVTINGNIGDCSNGLNSIYNESANKSVFYNTGTNTDGMTVTFGSQVTRVPAYIFLTRYDVSDNVYAHVKTVNLSSSITAIGESAFENCYDLTNVNFTDAAALQTIGNYAFRNANLQSLSFADNLSTISKSAFANNVNLKSIILPESLKTLGFIVFKNCTNLSSVTINGNIGDCSNGLNSIYNDSENRSVFYNTGTNTDGMTVTFGSSVTRVPAFIFLTRCDVSDNAYAHVKTVNLSSSITAIGESAFENCYDLTSVNFTDAAALQTIEDYAFRSSGLSSISFNDNLTTIGKGSFYGIEKLETVTLPKNLKTIGKTAFKDCTNLSKATFNGYNGDYAYDSLIIQSDAFDVSEKLTIYGYKNSNAEKYANERGIKFEPIQTVNEGWVNISGNWYYYMADGTVKTGWLKLSKTWYYLDSSGVMLKGWQKISGIWYYFKSSGAMVTGWQKISGKWYYFKSSGAMVTGWQKVSGIWYYFKSSGAMVTGWQKISGKWYYFKSSGAMVTGWQKVSGKWYYFTNSGSMKTGWLKLSGKWYYLDSSGAMVTGTKVIGGKTYNFNSSGVCLNP